MDIKKKECDYSGKNKKLKHAVIVVLLFICFLSGFFCLRSVGFYNDEGNEQNILRSNILDYFELISDDNDIVNYYHKKTKVIPISESVEKDHGVAVFLPFSPLLLVERVSPQIMSFLWHFYTYSIFFLGVIMVYKITSKLFKSKKLGFISSSVYMFSPRMFADGLYNNKDAVLLSLVLVTIYFGIQFIEKKDYKHAILFAIAAAFTFNIKIIGAFIFGVIGIFYLIKYFNESKKIKKWFDSRLWAGLLAIVVMFTVFIIITPAIWGNGFDLIGYIKWCLSESTNFSRWYGHVLFEGTLYQYSKGDVLPFYYLPKMILITTPPYITCLFVIGLCYIIYNFVKKKEKQVNPYFILILLCFIIPLCVAMLTHAKVYNGWRHFYFVYGPFVLIAAYGIYNLSLRLKRQNVFYGIIMLFVLFYSLGNVYYGVNGMSYYNGFINYDNVSDYYEMDYYGATTKQIMLRAIKNKSNDKVYLYSDGYGKIILKRNYKILSNRTKRKVSIVENIDDYNELRNKEEVYYYYNSVYNAKDAIKDKKEVYAQSAWGNDVIVLYK